MDTTSLAPRAPYVLYRVRPNGTEELVSEHPDFKSGWQAGTHVVTVEDTENAYSLYSGERRVARFGHARLMRQGTLRVEQFSSILVTTL